MGVGLCVILRLKHVSDVGFISRLSDAMARGRPRKNRTAEEAVVERREQVRKNVQAFRERKRLHKEQGNAEEGNESAEARGRSEVSITVGEPLDMVLPSDGEYSESIDAASARSVPTPSQQVSTGFVSSPDDAQAIALWIQLPAQISHAQLSRQQFVSNCLSAFRLESCPTSAGKTGPHWCETLPGIVNKDNTLDLSIQVVCLMQISNVNCERWILEEARFYYGEALRSLSRRLPKKEYSEEVFIAMMTLGGYELLQGKNANGTGWLIHHRAATKYLRKLSDSRGGFLPNNRAMFHFLETFCVFDALGGRKPSYFSASQAWSQSLDRFGGRTYGPLLRLLTDIPALLERHDKYVSMEQSVDSFVARSELLEECLKLEDGFREWHEHSFRHLPELWSASGTGELSFETEYSRLFIIRVHLLYWTALVLLLDTTASLFESMHGNTIVPGLLEQSVMLKDHTTRSNQYATYIRWSASFCLMPEHGLVGKTLLLLPIWVARNHFEHVHYWEETDMCNGVLDILGQRNMRFGLVVDEGD